MSTAGSCLHCGPGPLHRQRSVGADLRRGWPVRQFTQKHLLQPVKACRLLRPGRGMKSSIRALDAPMPFDFEHKAKDILAKQKRLKIGIVSFGNFGQFLARRMVQAGHDVRCSPTLGCALHLTVHSAIPPSVPAPTARWPEPACPTCMCSSGHQDTPCMHRVVRPGVRVRCPTHSHSLPAGAGDVQDGLPRGSGGHGRALFHGPQRLLRGAPGGGVRFTHGCHIGKGVLSKH